MIVPSLRNKAIYWAAYRHGMQLKQLAPLFGITPGRVSQICRKVDLYYMRRYV